MYVIVESGGKQYPVQEGDTLHVEKLPVDVGSEVTLDKVLLANNDGDVRVGTPYLEGKVVCEVLDQGKDKKILVFKHKRRKDYRKRQGHRQRYTKLKVNSIEV
jgi:large subunit ribosomal protein L21